MRVDVPVLAPYTFDAGAQVGTGDVWADGSDTTYISVNDSTPPIAHYARGAVETPLAGGHPYVPAAIAKAWVRYKYDGPLPDHTGHVRLTIGGLGVSYDASDVPQADEVPGWVITPIGGNVQELIQNWSGGFQVTLQLSSKFSGGAPLKVYEAAVRFEWKADAPPCRLFPRSDGLGVGSGRNYPPAKSQQRSNRGVGYY